jgi:hypothetical protein
MSAAVGGRRSEAEGLRSAVGGRPTENASKVGRTGYWGGRGAREDCDIPRIRLAFGRGWIRVSGRRSASSSALMERGDDVLPDPSLFFGCVAAAAADRPICVVPPATACGAGLASLGDGDGDDHDDDDHDDDDDDQQEGLASHCAAARWRCPFGLFPWVPLTHNVPVCPRVSPPSVRLSTGCLSSGVPDVAAGSSLAAAGVGIPALFFLRSIRIGTSSWPPFVKTGER